MALGQRQPLIPLCQELDSTVKPCLADRRHFSISFLLSWMVEGLLLRSPLCGKMNMISNSTVRLCVALSHSRRTKYWNRSVHIDIALCYPTYKLSSSTQSSPLASCTCHHRPKLCPCRRPSACRESWQQKLVRSRSSQ